MATANERLEAVRATLRETREGIDTQVNKIFSEVQGLKDIITSGGAVTEENLAGLEGEVLKLVDTKAGLQRVDDINPDATTEPQEPTGDDSTDDDFDLSTEDETTNQTS